MKKTFKTRKYFVLLIAIAFGFLLDTKIAFASGNGDMTIEEGAQPGIITQEAIEKELKLLRERVTFPSGCEINVTCYEQETNYWCGPATVKQVVKWITGTERAQSVYAQALGTTTAGTDMTRIPGVLNDYIDEQHYVYASIGTQSQWFSKIQSSVYYGRPAVLDLNTNDIDSFDYDSSGHFVNVSGYNVIDNTVRITDPYEGRGNVVHPADSLYEANNNHFRQAMIW